MGSRPAGGGGRWVEVDPQRLARWLAGFTERHGRPTVTAEGYGVCLHAPDGEIAECHAPPGAPAGGDLDGFVAAATAPRRIGLLLIRRGGYGVGVAAGPELVVSKVDSAYIQSRTAAGGWSQRRFARRRDNQARAAAADAADVAVRVLLPEADRLAAFVTGGDRGLVEAVLDDPRLAPLRALRSARRLDVPDPKLVVLRAAVSGARAVRIRLPARP